MKANKVLAILFAVLSLGALNEFIRICTSDAPDIAANRSAIMVTGGVMLAAFVFLAIFFYRKAFRR